MMRGTQCGIAVVMCLLLSASGALAQEPGAGKKAPPPYVRIVVNPQGLEGRPKAVIGAWVGYTSARAKWVQENWIHKPTGGAPYRRTFEEELYGRENMVTMWEELKTKERGLADAYQDDLLRVKKAGYLREYVWEYFRSPS